MTNTLYTCILFASLRSRGEGLIAFYNHWNGKKSDQPTMADLEGAGVIENNAHVIIILTNPHKEGEKFADTQGKYKKVWIVDKNRSGRTGRINMDWIPKHQRFEQSLQQDFSTTGKR